MIRRKTSAILGNVWNLSRAFVIRMSTLFGKLMSKMKNRTHTNTRSPGTNMLVNRLRPAGTMMVAAICILAIAATGLSQAVETPVADTTTESAESPEDPDLSTPAEAGRESIDSSQKSPFSNSIDTLDELESELLILARGLESEETGALDNASLDQNVVIVTPTPTPTPIVYPAAYEVATGESIWGIAEQMYGSADYIRLISYANNLPYHDPVVYSGQVLEIPDPSTPVPEPTPAPVYVSVGVGSGGEEPVAGYSAEDINLYLKIVAAEAGPGWSYNGVLRIAQVIVNRVENGRWGDLRGVLTAPRQFTPYLTGAYQYAVANPTERQAAFDALNGATIFNRDVLYFCTDKAYDRSAWFQSLPIADQYDNTLFFNP